MTLTIRTAQASDREAIVAMRCALWVTDSLEEHEGEFDQWLRGEPCSTLPVTILIAELDGAPAGFADVGMRSHADGCNPSYQVGYLEGWFVHEPVRRKGVGRALVEAGKDWARERGCREFASDTWSHAQHSIDAHQRLGFELVDKCVHFRIDL